MNEVLQCLNRYLIALCVPGAAFSSSLWCFSTSRPAGACRAGAPALPAQPRASFSWGLARDVWGVMLDCTELCINVETALEKSIWPPARKHCQPLCPGKAGPCPPSTSCPPALHPRGAGVTVLRCWLLQEVLGQLSTFSPCCSSAARMLPGK